MISPYGLALVSYAIFLFACLIPPSVYTHYMQEPDLMFLDPATILLYTLSVTAFIAGAIFIQWLFPQKAGRCILTPKVSPSLFLLLPLLCSVAVTVAAVVALVKSNPILLAALMSQKSGVKETMESDAVGRIILIPLQLAGVTWWTYSRYKLLEMRVRGRRAVKLVLLVALLTLLTSAVCMLNRSILMIPLCGLVILYVEAHNSTSGKSMAPLLKTGAIAAICVPLLFMAFSFLRGTKGWDDQVNALLGYTIAGYNRMAAVVNGQMRYPFAGSGVYLSSIVAHNSFLPFSKTLDMPDPGNVWGSEFQAVTLAGLDNRMIWAGTFGYLFSDLGWLCPFFVFGYGLLYGLIWKLFGRGNIIGVVLYPWFGFCIAFWFGTNYLLESPLEVFVAVAIVLFLYEALLTRRERDSTSLVTPGAAI